MRTGHVIEVRGDMARVSTSKQGPCEGCNEKGSCQPSFGSAAALLETVECRNLAGARRGDTVEIELLGHAELRVSLLVWIVPIVGLIAGAAVGAGVAEAAGVGPDVASLTGALLGVSGAYGALMRLDRRAATDARLVPAVKRVLERAHPRHPVRLVRCEDGRA